MNVYFTMASLEWLHGRLRWLTGEGSLTLARDVCKAIKEGNSYDRTNGRTSEGKPVAALKSKRRGIYAGKTGPPLAPSGAASRVVANFEAEPKRSGQNGYLITAGWRNVVSKKGFPFLPAHNEGRGHLPRRPIFGISPRTMASIRKLVDAFIKKASRKQS